jgi:hypothetical protein
MKRFSIAIAGVLSAFIFSAPAAQPTAFDVIKEANRHVGDEAKDKIVQIRSEKSVGDLAPNIWYVVFYDRDATFKATEVKIGAGKKMDVKRPMRMLEYVKAEKILDRQKITVDSDRALATATKEPLLERLTLKASQMWLEPREIGPVWRVRLFAAKLRKPNDTADIGEVWISAEDGKVIKTDLHINRVD